MAESLNPNLKSHPSYLEEKQTLHHLDELQKFHILHQLIQID